MPLNLIIFLINYIIIHDYIIIPLEMKCRLDEEIDVEDVTVTWFFNDKEFTESDRVQITFDGTYAKVFIAG